DVLRETMFAPTVVGSPIENACRVVARHERRGRGYYGGVLALIDRETLDAPILIRTVYVDAAGRLRVPVGATLVRHSTAARGGRADVRGSAGGAPRQARGGSGCLGGTGGTRPVCRPRSGVRGRCGGAGRSAPPQRDAGPVLARAARRDGLRRAVAEGTDSA